MYVHLRCYSDMQTHCTCSVNLAQVSNRACHIKQCTTVQNIQCHNKSYMHQKYFANVKHMA